MQKCCNQLFNAKHETVGTVYAGTVRGNYAQNTKNRKRADDDQARNAQWLTLS